MNKYVLDGNGDNDTVNIVHKRREDIIRTVDDGLDDFQAFYGTATVPLFFLMSQCLGPQMRKKTSLSSCSPTRFPASSDKPSLRTQTKPFARSTASTRSFCWYALLAVTVAKTVSSFASWHCSSACSSRA